LLCERSALATPPAGIHVIPAKTISGKVVAVELMPTGACGLNGKRMVLRNLSSSPLTAMICIALHIKPSEYTRRFDPYHLKPHEEQVLGCSSENGSQIDRRLTYAFFDTGYEPNPLSAEAVLDYIRNDNGTGGLINNHREKDVFVSYRLNLKSSWNSVILKAGGGATVFTDASEIGKVKYVKPYNSPGSTSPPSCQ